MRVTRVELKIEDSGNLKAYANIVIDDKLAILGLKLIKGHSLFVEFPTLEGFAWCQSCNHKHLLDARFCPRCGVPIREDYHRRTESRRNFVHPVEPSMREHITLAVIKAYADKVLLSRVNPDRHNAF